MGVTKTIPHASREETKKEEKIFFVHVRVYAMICVFLYHTYVCIYDVYTFRRDGIRRIGILLQ